MSDDLFPKVIEAIGRQLRPALFAVLGLSAIGLVLPVWAWRLVGAQGMVVPAWWLVTMGGFAALFLIYDPVVTRLRDSAASGQVQGIQAARRKIVEGLSANARTWLFVLLQMNGTQFIWKVGAPLVSELDGAGIIVPNQATSNTHMRYTLGSWYWDMAIGDRTWLLANLRPDANLLPRYIRHWQSGADDDERI